MNTEPTILDTIAAATVQRVEEAKNQVPLEQVRAAASDLNADTGYPFDQALRGPDIAFICECKQASPSKGLIAADYPYVDIARSYQEAGAHAISVLTEPQWFKGSPQHLKDIAATVTIPVLRKDFVVDPYQIYEAKVLGASAILLICSLLSDDQLAHFHSLARGLGLSALVEAHNQVEIERALIAGASIIGVNNRDLRDFTVEPGRAASLREMVPADVAFVAESGISTPLQVDTLRATGVNAVLVGETLMRASDRRGMLDYLRGASTLSPRTPDSGDPA